MTAESVSSKSTGTGLPEPCPLVGTVAPFKRRALANVPLGRYDKVSGFALAGSVPRTLEGLGAEPKLLMTRRGAGEEAGASYCWREYLP